MYFVAALLLALPLAAQDARQIVLESLKRDQDQAKLAEQYTFVQRSEQRELDDSGKVKKREIKTHDILFIDGTSYSRLIAKDDHPLSPEEEAKEKKKLDKAIEERHRESPEKRAKRKAKQEQEKQKQLESLRQIPEAFDLTLTGEQELGGKRCWVINAVPRPGYKPTGEMMTKLFPKMKGRLFVDQASYRWVRAEAEVTDTISFGWGIARIHKGTQFHFEQLRVNDEVWLPKEVGLRGSARIALVKKMSVEVDVAFRDYRKFQTDSRITGVSELPEESKPQ